MKPDHLIYFLFVKWQHFLLHSFWFKNLICFHEHVTSVFTLHYQQINEISEQCGTLVLSGVIMHTQ